MCIYICCCGQKMSIFDLTRYIQICIFSLNFGFNLILHAFPLLLHSTFPSPIFSYKVNFIFFPAFPCLYSLLLLLSLPLLSKNLFPLVISYSLSSHSSLHLLTPLLILLHWLLIM